MVSDQPCHLLIRCLWLLTKAKLNNCHRIVWLAKPKILTILIVTYTIFTIYLLLEKLTISSIFVVFFLWAQIFLFSSFLLFMVTLGKWKFPGQGLNQSCSCWPLPQPQPHQIRAMSVTYTTAHGSTGSLFH